MKRISFKPEFVDLIRSGAKTATFRFATKTRHPKPGDLLAAVTKNGKRPAFLVPAKDRFATIRVTNVTTLHCWELTEDQLERTHETIDWCKELIKPWSSAPGYFIEFEVVKNEACR